MIKSFFSRQQAQSFFIQKYSSKPALFIKKNKQFFLSLFLAFLISDLLLIKSYSFLIPNKDLPPISLDRDSPYQPSSLESYQDLWVKNIFHTGPLPQQLQEEIVYSEPALSSLPFKLKGTIIHANPRRSVATISAGPGNKTLSYQQGDVIEKQAEIREIQRAKVVFFNQNNLRLEYILIPEEKHSLNISYKKDKAKVLNDRLVLRTGDNEFQVKRSDVNEYLLKLPEILKQARMVPHRSESGEILGFRFSSINKDSVFEELGFEKGDVIKEVNGEQVRTPEKALELFEKLKSTTGIKILVERGGQTVYNEYNVRENAPIPMR